jgi:molybdopterin-guanine dinucleotide biosynthesis protein A
MGPLGGIAAALHLARDEGYEAVLTCGVDSLGLPDDLPDAAVARPRLSREPAGVGLWPPAACGDRGSLHRQGRHSMLAFAEAIGARAVKLSAAKTC